MLHHLATTRCKNPKDSHCSINCCRNLQTVSTCTVFQKATGQDDSSQDFCMHLFPLVRSINVQFFIFVCCWLVGCDALCFGRQTLFKMSRVHHHHHHRRRRHHPSFFILFFFFLLLLLLICFLLLLLLLLLCSFPLPLSSSSSTTFPCGPWLLVHSFSIPNSLWPLPACFIFPFYI